MYGNPYSACCFLNIHYFKKTLLTGTHIKSIGERRKALGGKQL